MAIWRVQLSLQKSVAWLPPLAQLNKMQKRSLIRLPSGRASHTADVLLKKPLYIYYTYLWPSESPTVTELEVNKCLMPYSFSQCFIHSGMKTWPKWIKILPSRAENLCFIHFNNLFRGLILRNCSFQFENINKKLLKIWTDIGNKLKIYQLQ